ncbi:MAG: hypothetical protein R2708_11590 [Vicinamibacterales bacterium]
MSVLAMVVVTQWAEAELAATPVAGRPWTGHLVDRLRRAPVVSDVAVVCQPACRDRVAPHVPPGVACVTAADPFAWAAAGAAPLVAWVPVWQLFADPGRLARLAAAAQPAGTTVVRAVLEHAPSVDLTGGADVQVFTATGLRMAADGLDIGPGVLAVPRRRRRPNCGCADPAMPDGASRCRARSWPRDRRTTCPPWKP